MVPGRQLDCNLHGAFKPRKRRSQPMPKRRPIQKRTTSPMKLPNQQTASRGPKLSAPECAAYPLNSANSKLCEAA